MAPGLGEKEPQEVSRTNYIKLLIFTLFDLQKCQSLWFGLKKGFGNLDYSEILPRIIRDSTYTLTLPPLLFYPNTLMKAKNDFGQIFIFKFLILPVDIKPLYGFHCVQIPFFFFKLAFSVCFGVLVGYLASMGYVFITCILQ